MSTKSFFIFNLCHFWFIKATFLKNSQIVASEYQPLFLPEMPVHDDSIN